MSVVTQPMPTGGLFAGRYRLLGPPLGSGTSGEVWRAEDTHLGREVALKILIETEEDDAWQESRRLTTLESPNVLKVHNADLAIDVPYIDSALATGGTADDELRPFGLTQERAIHLIRGALRGLQLCHEHRILHRDVKPANIFIGSTGDAQLGDFGCAGLMAADGSAKPHGDPDVRPLDVLKGAPCTAASDVYGAGLSLYAMLAGALPFSIAAAGNFKAHRENVAAGMPDIRDVAPHIGTSLAKVVRKATAPKASDRYQSAAEFSAALAALPVVSSDIRRIDGSHISGFTHSGHARCWQVTRRKDGHVIYVCVATVNQPHAVEVKRGNGNRMTRYCKQGLRKPECLVHLRKVFNDLR